MDIWNFISTHLRLILEGCLVVLLFILQLIKKRPITYNKSIFELIYSLVPKKINSYEKFFGEGHGSEKKDRVVTSILDEIERIYPLTDRQRDGYKYFISNFVEEVLSTPQKK